MLWYKDIIDHVGKNYCLYGSCTLGYYKIRKWAVVGGILNNRVVTIKDTHWICLQFPSEDPDWTFA